jgi:hypothetical protein
MITTIENLKSTLNLLPISEDTKSKLIKSSETILEFRNFISEKYTITGKDADEKIQKQISILTSSVSDVDLNEVSTQALNYAKSEGWNNYEELKQAIIDMYNSVNELQSMINQ